MEVPLSVPARVEDTVARLRASGLCAHLVGGAVRDLLLGREARDFDLVTDGDLETARRALPEAVQVSARRPVLLLAGREGEPRLEIRSFRGGARSLEEDLKRRDFTLNAMALDPGSGQLVDPLRGREDLSSRVLRAADPDHAFRDDAVRILRGIRLALELDLSTDPATEAAMREEAWRLRDASPERLRDELFRLLGRPRPSEGIRRLAQVGGLAPLLPALLPEIGVEQNRHHPEDVFDHSLRVCDLVRPDPLLRLAALLHDAGKPECRRLDDTTGEVSFRRHPVRGADHARCAATRLRLSNQQGNRLERLVRYHGIFPRQLEHDAAVRRMLRRAGRDILSDLLELRRADLASHDPRGEVPESWKSLEQRIRRIEQESRSTPPRLAIGGKEVMQELGIEAGPQVGRWLRRARRRVEEQPEENHRERLLAWLREAREREQS